MNFEAALQVANEAFFAHTQRYLSDVEVTLLRGAWQNQTYQEMSENTDYTANYLQRTVGPKLWKQLSEALGESVSKTNFREALKREMSNRTPSATLTVPPSAHSVEFPDKPVALDSQFYIERPPIEVDCYQAIVQPGALIRIKAPQQMGKTSLLYRILTYAATHGYRTVRLNLREAEGAVFSSLDKFLRWFCANVTLQLELPNQLDNYWNEAVIGSMVSCKTYFQSYLLKRIDSPLVLALDEVDQVFQYPDIAKYFFPMLRSWHEEANNRAIWQQMRLIVVHSTEVYIPLNINQSPFNVGLPVDLKEFTPNQVANLAACHQLTLQPEEVEQIISMIGGHPYLLRLAFYHLSRQDVTLSMLLQDAPTDGGIYSDYLRRNLVTLKRHPELAAALKQVVTATKPVRLDTIQAYQLHSMGLIQRQGDLVMPSCELYRHYFHDRLDNEG
ncbi:AAA-like domain-containing protein [Limnofasciculus baicalensis]|uniref:AAA-like domain-containing protein n=1 Tax=Limnofasciculus baicalensis BBK-W-15 TaxID=2699891 RepID=A0AAE3GXY4_9CYAN|nr:AAA-like domain-containing protein [Limnofasciculus baicalensis]MCP2732594.1 AAA-like domain-containing protein [Limnofasciculus baicalensis BBK-W-15]